MPKGMSSGLVVTISMPEYARSRGEALATEIHTTCSLYKISCNNITEKAVVAAVKVARNYSSYERPRQLETCKI